MKSKPHYITEQKRTMHIHCLGQTGTGKSASVIMPMFFQDVLANKGVILMDAKGSKDNINAAYNICAVANRIHDLRIFSLSFPEMSHTYNPLWVKSIDLDDFKKSGDPELVKERVMSVFKEDMENPYYRNNAETFFNDLLRVLHGIIDNHGQTIPFNMRDVLCCIQNFDILNKCVERTKNRQAVVDLLSQIRLLGDKPQEIFSGLRNLLTNYTSDSLNHYNPDIILDEVLQNNQIVYFQLPANLKGNLTAQIGKMVLQDLQQAASRRQTNRSINQKPFALYVDEAYNFAFPGMIDALNKLRDANIQILLAHQSISDLERVSKEFAMGIWDNTRTKIVLYQNNPELCEKISKSIGTYSTIKRTVRRSIGALFTEINMGESSVREVEEFVLNPSAIKNLASKGQAYIIEGNKFTLVNLAMLPLEFFKDPKIMELKPKNPNRSGLNLRELLLASVEDLSFSDSFRCGKSRKG